MSQRSEYYLKCTPQNESIYIQRWQPTNTVRATVLLTHGVAEHSECYHNTAESFATQGFDVWSWDLPGHGKSYGQRGYVSSFSEYMERMLNVLTKIRELTPADRPLVLFGHSLGGLITFQFGLLNPDFKATAYCLSSPAFGVKIEVPFYKDQAARILVHLAPKLTIPHQIIYEDLSRDTDLIKTYYKDPLRHSKYSAPLYLGTLEAMQSAKEKAQEFKKPILIQAAGQDRIVDTLATQELFPLLGSNHKKMKIYPESYHEIYNDTNKQEVIDDLLHFLRELNI